MISTTTNRVVLNGDGSSVSFFFPYEFFSQSDLKVYLYNSSASSGALQVLNTNYSVGGTANFQGIYPNGGTVIFASSVPAALQVVITRDPSQVQNYQLLQNGQINSVALVQQLDYMTLLIQRLQDQATRSLRLPEGFGLTFDPTLPYGINQMAGQPVVVNSGANGFTFQALTASYIPNTVIMALSTSVLGSIGGSPSGYVLQSNGSSAPGWAAVSLSGSSVVGTLTLANGGTGGLAPQQWGVVYASSATQLATTDPAPVGLPLISNASSAPSFQQLDLASAVTGTLAVGKGGTGLASYTQYALIYASASNALAQIPSAISGYVLTANGSSAPTWQPATGGATGSSALLVVNNLSDVTSKTAAFQNISPATIFGDILYAGSGVIMTRLAAGTSGNVLSTNGAGAAPTWVSALTNPMTTGGDVIYGGSSGTPVRLANGTSGQVLTSAGGSSGPTWSSLATLDFYSGFTTGATWSTTNTSFADPTVSGTNTLTQRQASGLTVAAAGSSFPGVTFTPANASAVYRITASFQGFNATAAGDNAGWSMTDGSTQIAVAGIQSYAVSNGTAWVVLEGIFVPGTGSAVTVKVQGAANAGTCSWGQAVTGGGTKTSEWTITRLK